MRNKNNNSISNAWKRFSRSQKDSTSDMILQSVSVDSRSGMFYRDGHLDGGSVQMFNLESTDYIIFGGNSGGGTKVGP